MNRIKLINDYTIFVGDIHGEWIDLYRKTKKYDLTDCTLILCGDIGIGFERSSDIKRTLKYFNELFLNKNIHVYAYRGNHDDPSYFTDNSINQYSNIHLIPDYTVLENDTDNILCIGGGVSIDRTFRKMYRDYWPDEISSKNEEILKQLKDITIVATHSSPTFTFPLIKSNLDYWAKKDKDILTDVDNDRKTVDSIYEELASNDNPIRKWYYGHYHNSNKERVFGIDFILLDIMEFSI